MKKLSLLQLAASLLGSALIATATQAKDFRLGLLTPPQHIWSQAASAFAADFEQHSQGRHKVALFPAAQLGNEAQMLQQLQTGALDMAFLTNAELSNRAPELSALYAPYLVQSVEQAGQLLTSPQVQQLLDQLPTRAGVVGLAFGTGGLRQILSRNPVHSAADLQGRKLRVTPIEALRDFYSQLGAAPTPIPLSGVFDALANGQVDAVDMDLELIWGLKFYEKADTILLSKHMMWPVVGVVSARVWRELSPEDRQALQTLMRKHLAQTFTAYIAKEREWEQAVRGSGKRIVEVGPEFFAAAIEAWEAKWRQKAPALPALRQLAKSLQ